MLGCRYRCRNNSVPLQGMGRQVPAQLLRKVHSIGYCTTNHVVALVSGRGKPATVKRVSRCGQPSCEHTE